MSALPIMILTEERIGESTKISQGKENGKGKITKEKQHGSQGDGLCETNKEMGKVTTQQSDCLGDLFLQFVPPPSTLLGERALRSNCELKPSSLITGHFSWGLPVGKYLFM